MKEDSWGWWRGFKGWIFLVLFQAVKHLLKWKWRVDIVKMDGYARVWQDGRLWGRVMGEEERGDHQAPARSLSAGVRCFKTVPCRCSISLRCFWLKRNGSHHAFSHIYQRSSLHIEAGVCFHGILDCGHSCRCKEMFSGQSSELCVLEDLSTFL